MIERGSAANSAGGAESKVAPPSGAASSTPASSTRQPPLPQQTQTQEQRAPLPPAHRAALQFAVRTLAIDQAQVLASQAKARSHWQSTTMPMPMGQPLDFIMTVDPLRWVAAQLPGAAPLPPHIARLVDGNTHSEDNVIMNASAPVVAVAAKAEKTPQDLQLVRSLSSAAAAGDRALAELRRRIMRALTHIDLWSFDIFALEDAALGCPLVYTVFALCHRYDLITRMNLDARVLFKFVSGVEAGYKAHNPYHNATHGADVTQVRRG
jgi:hypothetical protein